MTIVRWLHANCKFCIGIKQMDDSTDEEEDALMAALFAADKAGHTPSLPPAAGTSADSSGSGGYQPTLGIDSLSPEPVIAAAPAVYTPAAPAAARGAAAAATSVSFSDLGSGVLKRKAGGAPAGRRRDCHSAATPSPFSRCSNMDGAEFGDASKMTVSPTASPRRGACLGPRWQRRGPAACRVLRQGFGRGP